MADWEQARRIVSGSFGFRSWFPSDPAAWMNRPFGLRKCLPENPNTNEKSKQSILHYKGVSYVMPFILITVCFALWGFANDITNPMVKAFSKIFRMSVTDGALVQVAFYGGYFAMAFPAAVFIRKYSYKAGVLLGLGLYAVGALLFFPAKLTGSYYPFLLAYFILTCGLSFLETSAIPTFSAWAVRKPPHDGSIWRKRLIRSVRWQACGWR